MRVLVRSEHVVLVLRGNVIAQLMNKLVGLPFELAPDSARGGLSSGIYWNANTTEAAVQEASDRASSRDHRKGVAA